MIVNRFKTQKIKKSQKFQENGKQACLYDKSDYNAQNFINWNFKMEQYLQLSKEQTAKAREIIKSLKIIETWQKADAVVNLIGSLKIGVLGKHRDIDFHVYTDKLDIKQSFKVMAALCGNEKIKKCTFENLAQTDECCLEWHLFYEDDMSDLWQIDIIQIKKGSFYDGYFENVAKQIIAAMSPKQQETIIRLKFETPDDVKISGMEYYKAVIQDNVQSFEELLQWRQTHHFDTLIKW